MYQRSKYTIARKILQSYVLFNTYSGVIVKVDKRIYDAFASNRFPEEQFDEAQLKTLLRHNFIVPDHLDEYHKILSLEQRELFKNTGRLVFVIAPTTKCNYRCGYCFEPKQKLKRMSAQTVSDVIRFLKSRLTEDVKAVKITWFGGEPLLEMETIQTISREIISHCDALQIQYGSNVITNGYFLTPKNATALHDGCRVRSVQVTLDGKGERYQEIKGAPSGAYDRVLSNIQSAAKRMNVAVRLNIAPEDYPTLGAFVGELMRKFEKDRRVSLYLAEVCSDWADNAEKPVKSSLYMGERRKFEQYLFSHDPGRLSRKIELRCPHLKCGLIRKQNAVIGPEGELYRCEHMLGRKEEIIGTCRDGLYYNCADWKFDTFVRPDKCRDCVIFPICLSECPNDLIENKTQRIDCEESYNLVMDSFERLAVSRLKGNRSQ